MSRAGGRNNNEQCVSPSGDIVVTKYFADNKVKKKNSNVSVIHQNIQSLRNKVDRLEIFLKHENPDLVVFTEHDLKDTEISQINIPGFSIKASYCRQQHKSGGVCCFTNKSMPLNTRGLGDHFPHEIDMEAVGLEVRLDNNMSIAVVGIYIGLLMESETIFVYTSLGY